MLSVIILQYNNAALTKKAIRSFQEHCHSEHEIILVDNNSTEKEAREIAAGLNDVQFIQNGNNDGFSKANNQAARIARGEILLFLNNDTVAESDFVSPVLRKFSEDQSLGIVGPKLLNEDHTYQLSCGRLPSLWREAVDKVIYAFARQGMGLHKAEKKYAQSAEVEWVTGAALFIRTNLFKRLSGFDERLFMFFEDKDLCLRARKAGSKVFYFPGVSLVHLGGGSNTAELKTSTEKLYRQSQMIFYKKHLGPIQQRALSLYLQLAGKRY